MSLYSSFTNCYEKEYIFYIINAAIYFLCALDREFVINKNTKKAEQKQKSRKKC